MKPDLSFWGKNFPDLKFKHTKELLYGKYPYRLEIIVLGGRVLSRRNNVRSSRAFQVNYRQLIRYIDKLKDGTYPNSYEALKWKDKELDYALLLALNDIFIDHDDSLRVRVEGWARGGQGHTVFISSNDLNLLKRIAALCKRRFSDVRSLTLPENEKAQKILMTGAVLKKYKHEFKYRIILKPTSRVAEPLLEDHRNKIVDMLKELPDVYIPPITEERIRKRFWWGNAIIYTNDPSSLAFVQLVDPYIIGKISPIVCISDK